MTLSLTAVTGFGEIGPGDDIAALIAEHADLADGDVVVVTSKIVSKALGLATTRPAEELIAALTDRVVAERGPTQIVRTHHGLTMAAAGVDASNIKAGTILPLPADPDAEARAIRAALRRNPGVHVGVVISDTAGRAWRHGQTDIAIGCAGLLPAESFEGRADDYGNPLMVTAPAVADEIAGAAELASGKLSGRPVVVVRGLAGHLLTDEDGPGATSLVREEEADLFGLGAREAVLAALHDAGAAVRGFPANPHITVQDVLGLATAGHTMKGLTVSVEDETVSIGFGGIEAAVRAGELAVRVRALATAHSTPLRVVTRSAAGK